MKTLQLNQDAFSHGQIHSKIWLCEELEKMSAHLPSPVIWVLGGWYGVLPFLIFSRGILKPKQICSFDIDQTASNTSEKINNAWSFDPALYFYFTADVTKLDYAAYGNKPDIVINTSCEHFSSAWIDLVPPGTLIAAQSTNMEHAEHVFKSNSVEHFKENTKGLINAKYAGQKDFAYGDFQFSRYLLIGPRI